MVEQAGAYYGGFIQSRFYTCDSHSRKHGDLTVVVRVGRWLHFASLFL
jgi:hypothetical protein